MDLEREEIRSLLEQPAIVIEPDATLRQVAGTLAENYIGVAVVRGSRPMGAPGSRAEGVVSERDIVRALADGADPDVERAENVMTADLATASPGDAIRAVAERMLADEIRHIPVTEAGGVMGVVSERDLLRAFVRAQDS